MSKKLDDTIDLDSTTEDTIVLDDSKDHTVDLVSSGDEDNEQNYVTAASNTRFLDNTATSPPKVTSTPNVEQRHVAQTSLFQEVEDEFVHDDSITGEAAAVTAHEKSLDDDSAIESETPEKAPVESARQISSSDIEEDVEESSVSEQADIENDEEKEVESVQKESLDSSMSEPEKNENDEDTEEEKEVESVKKEPVEAAEESSMSEPEENENDEDTDDEKEDDDEDEEGEESSLRRTVDWDSLDLPETCTLLTTNKGAKVFLVGTAHFSKESQTDVSQVMRAVQPDIVVLELCKSRTNILYMDEETILSESQNLTTQKALQTIREYGTVQGVMYLLMLSMSASLTKTLGMAPGGEFRMAFRESQNIPGCIVHLGDRPIHITLKRALASLTTWQRIKLAFNILTSRDEITKEDVERCKQKDLLESMLEEMAGTYPSMSRVFVEERDTFLAYSLLQAADAPFQNGCSEPPVVVGVVGIGHMSGIQQKFNTVKAVDVAQVIQIPPQSQTSKYFKMTFRASFWALAAFGLYKFFKPRLLR